MSRVLRSRPLAATTLGLSLATLLLTLSAPPTRARTVQYAQGVQTLTDGVIVETGPSASAPSSDPPSSITTPPTDSQPTVDESALRYYARTGQYDRVELEVGRLRAQYPDWSPPADLFDPAPATDGANEQPLWDLLAAGDLDAYDQAAARFATSHPGWTPSPSLARERALAGARTTLNTAAVAGDWATVVRQGGSTPGLIGCADPQSTWDYARALVETSRDLPGAKATLATLVHDCKDFGVRLATLQKAAALLPWADVEALTALEAQHSRTPSQDTAFARVRADLGKGRVATALSDKTAKLDPTEVATLERTTEAARDADGASLLGWYYLRAKAYTKADPWFRRALTWGYSDKAAEGLVRTRLGQGDHKGAMSLIDQYGDQTPNLRDIRRELATRNVDSLSPAGLESLGRQVAASHDARGATQLGWRAYRDGRDNDAVHWFENAVNWGDRKAVEGLVLAYLRLGDTTKAQSLTDKWSGRYPKLQEYMEGVGGGLLADAAEAARREDFAGCLRLVDRAQAKSGPSLAGWSQRGWCLLELDRPAEAMQAFQTGLAPPLGGVAAQAVLDANAGVLWSMLAQDMAAQVLTIIQRVDLSDQDRRTIQLEAITRRALEAYHLQDWDEALRLLTYRNRVLPRERGLTEIEAWTLYHLHRRSEAKALFEMLDQQFSTPETREALIVLEESRFR